VVAGFERGDDDRPAGWGAPSYLTAGCAGRWSERSPSFTSWASNRTASFLPRP